MKQNVLVGLAVVAVLFTTYTILANRGPKKDVIPDPVPKPLDVKEVYNQWKLQNNFKVGSAEDESRFRVFSYNYDFVQKHNSNPASTYTVSLNQFAHLTTDEFAALHLGLLTPRTLKSSTPASEPTIEKLADIPDSWDWEKQGKVTRVIDQGQCGISGALPAIQASESLVAINGGPLAELSIQQGIDCGPSMVSGCCGQMPSSVFEYIRDVGLVSAEAYPYTAVDGTCNMPVNATKTKIGGYVNVTENSEEALRVGVYKNPVASGVDAASQGFQLYQSGIMTADKCTDQPDHGVLIVGYGSENSTAFWRVKNSWGPAWGENGYFRLQRLDGKGACGINVMVNYPTN